MNVDEPDADGLYPKWDGPSLFKRRSEVAPSVWAMVYQQEDVQEDSIFSPLCGRLSQRNAKARTSKGRRTWSSKAHVESGYTIIGLDPAMAGATGAVVCTYNRADGKIYVLRCCQYDRAFSSQDSKFN
jgi:hypothetical protein